MNNLIILVVVFAEAVLLMAHWFLYRTVVRFFNLSNGTVLLSLKIILFLLSLLFVAGSLMIARYDNIFSRALYVAGAFWMGLLLYLLLASAILWLFAFLSGTLAWKINWPVITGCLFGLAILISVYGVINAAAVRVTCLEIKLNNLPVAWQGKTAVWISDLHLGQVHGEEFAKLIAQKIQDLHPDTVFVGGDFFDGVAGDLDKLSAPFSEIKAPSGIYFVTGNHEEFSDKTKYLSTIAKTGMKILNDEKIEIDRLQIIGVDYSDVTNKDNFKNILSGLNINKNEPSILLKHSPGSPEVAAEQGISLQISGHAHQGQFFPVNFITALIYRGYDFGLKRIGQMQIYTSSGVGTWGPPLRVATTPEIVRILFK